MWPWSKLLWCCGQYTHGPVVSTVAAKAFIKITGTFSFMHYTRCFIRADFSENIGVFCSDTFPHWLHSTGAGFTEDVQGQTDGFPQWGKVTVQSKQKLTPVNKHSPSQVTALAAGRASVHRVFCRCGFDQMRLFSLHSLHFQTTADHILTTAHLQTSAAGSCLFQSKVQLTDVTGWCGNKTWDITGWGVWSMFFFFLNPSPPSSSCSHTASSPMKPCSPQFFMAQKK